MNPFQFVETSSFAEASRLVEADPVRNRFIAGGTDIMGEIKEGVVTPAILVSLSNLEGLKGINIMPDSLHIGALTTLAELESDPHVAQAYPALAQAIASVATPQIRNVGTLGGNLCQRPRCWYYRSPLFDCRKKGGTICYAINGNDKYHAILGGGDCFIVHPSDSAVALISYRAQATIAGPDGSRSIALEEFFAGPEHNIMAETVLGPGQILTGVDLPNTTPHHRSVYLKARERQTEDFALSSVALVLEVTQGQILDARLTLGGVAPVPLRVRHAEDALRGHSLDQVDSRVVGELAVQGARPMRDNHFKVALTSSLVRRAVTALLYSDGAGSK